MTQNTMVKVIGSGLPDGTPAHIEQAAQRVYDLAQKGVFSGAAFEAEVRSLAEGVVSEVQKATPELFVEEPRAPDALAPRYAATDEAPAPFLPFSGGNLPEVGELESPYEFEAEGD